MRIKLSQFFSRVSGKADNFLKIGIKYKEIDIKQQAQASHLRCVLAESKCCEPMQIKI